MTTTPNPGQPTDAAPCPFCGGTDGSVQEGSTFRWRRWICDCGVAGPEARVKTTGSGSAEQWEAQGRIDAVKAWNTRADKNKAKASMADELFEAVKILDDLCTNNLKAAVFTPSIYTYIERLITKYESLTKEGE